MKKIQKALNNNFNTENIGNVHIVTMGCPKNVVDSEVLSGRLAAADVNIVNDPLIAETVIINTCGFINSAKEESLGIIAVARQLKKDGIVKKVIVCGCLSQRYPDALQDEFPEVDYFFGVNETDKIVKALKPDYAGDSYYQRILQTPPHYSYLKISEGCNHACSFCAIPLIKGSYLSRPLEELVDEAKSLSLRGVKELMVIAQDTTYYGVDMYGERRLGTLLEQLSEIEDLKWIRLMYTHPSAFPEDVLHVIAERHNICKYIDIPLQHINEKILSSMKRATTQLHIERLIDKIRNTIPDVAIRSTFIVGYPGETDKQFMELVKFIERSEFERVGVFGYSPEDGTSAWDLRDNIPAHAKEERIDAIMYTQQGISMKKNRQKIGRSLEVLIDNDLTTAELKESDFDKKIYDKIMKNNKQAIAYFGRTMHDAPEIDNAVLVISNEKIEHGTFVKVRIEAASEYDLYGRGE